MKIKISNTGKKISVTSSNCRTKAQFETVRSLVELPEFAFACVNPFDEDWWDANCSKYQAFAFTYYTYDVVGGMLDKLHVKIIEPSGRISKEVSA